MMKNIKNTLILLLLSTAAMTFYAQVQVGSTLISSEDGFGYGQNVQLSQDGKRLVVSGFGASNQGAALFENINGVWVEQSFMETSDAPDGQTIYSVSMSPDGNQIAVGSVMNNFNADEDFGSVKVFQYRDNEWSQKGNTIHGDFDDELFGRSIAITNDGNRVIVGARLNSEVAYHGGRVAVYQFANTIWSQLGQSIYGIKRGFKAGSAVAISGDGSHIYMGSNTSYRPSAPNSEFYSMGNTEVYRWEDTMWVMVHERMGHTSDQFGFSVAVSNDGELFAVGANQFKYKNGYVNVYKKTDGSYIKLPTIYGGEREYLGSSISLSGDGNKMVVGAILSESSTYFGVVRLYEYNGREYVPVGRIEGDIDNPKFGISVNMSVDGTTIAVGALDYNGAGTERGSVTVYDISGIASPDPFVEEVPENLNIIKIYPSPATDVLLCENCENVIEWYIADVSGKIVLTHLDVGEILNTIDVSVLQSGIYYAYLNKGSNDFEVKKFIKK